MAVDASAIVESFVGALAAGLILFSVALYLFKRKIQGIPLNMGF